MEKNCNKCNCEIDVLKKRIDSLEDEKLKKENKKLKYTIRYYKEQLIKVNKELEEIASPEIVNDWKNAIAEGEEISLITFIEYRKAFEVRNRGFWWW